MLYLTVLLSIEPTKTAAFLAAMAANAAATRLEPGCRRFEVQQVEGSASEYVLWEVFDDARALEAHHASPHFARWSESARDLVLAKRSVRGVALPIA